MRMGLRLTTFSYVKHAVAATMAAADASISGRETLDGMASRRMAGAAAGGGRRRRRTTAAAAARARALRQAPVGGKPRGASAAGRSSCRNGR